MQFGNGQHLRKAKTTPQAWLLCVETRTSLDLTWTKSVSCWGLTNLSVTSGTIIVLVTLLFICIPATPNQQSWGCTHTFHWERHVSHYGPLETIVCVCVGVGGGCGSVYACKYAHHKMQVRSYYLKLHQATYRPGPIMLHFSPIKLCMLPIMLWNLPIMLLLCPIKYSNNENVYFGLFKNLKKHRRANWHFIKRERFRAYFF